MNAMASLDLESNLTKPRSSDSETAAGHKYTRSPPDLEERLSNEEKNNQTTATTPKQSVYKGLGWLDRLLALWILIAIIVGITIGNYVDGAEAALQRGKFVDVSVPIGP